MEDGSIEEQGSGDPLERMAAHRHARELRKLSWADAEIAQRNPIMAEVVAQFHESIGSIAANIAEGYSKSSGLDRARSFEYALVQPGRQSSGIRIWSLSLAKKL